jgi:WhiB family redox-sensing transcriptional regulator
MSHQDHGFAQGLASTLKPCSGQTPLFFGGHTEYEDGERGGPTKRLLTQAKSQSMQARRLCMQCPLATLRACAQFALDSDNEYGVWAGVQLPGHQTRKAAELAEQRALLAKIANGSIDPYTHESNEELFTPQDGQLVLFPPRQDQTPAADLTSDAVLATA